MKIIINESQIGTIALFENMADINKKANEANIDPTDAQKKAGNYKMGHLIYGGFPVSIENPKGSKRYFTGKYGKKEFVVMKNHYGYFTKTKGYDGDQVDVFLGPNEDFDTVYVVDQNNTDGKFDESKVMLGFSSKEEAKKAYMSNFDKTWKGFRCITGVPKDVFKKWLYTGRKQKKAFYKYNIVKRNIRESIEEDKAFHGTNTTFDKFDTAFMGSGSGRQDWGYGIYLTRSRDLAQRYGEKVYTVEFPDDSGSNYIYASEFLTPQERKRYKDIFFKYMVSRDPESYGNPMAQREFSSELEHTFGDGMDGIGLYGSIESYLGDPKETAEFCSKQLGKVGLKYNEKDIENIVIFDQNNVKIVDDSTGNSQLNKAKDIKNDEFYTRIDDIAKELVNYADKMRGKVIFCNCDNPNFSNFYKYLKENFSNFGLKMLVSCGIGSNGKGQCGLFDGRTEEINEMQGDGGFESSESLNYLKNSDIVISNPPFSLFRKYLDIILSYGKDFILLGNMNAVKNKDTYQYFLQGKIRTGFTGFNKGMYFNVPDGFQYSSSYKGKTEMDGQSVARVSGISWFTNMFEEKPIKPVVLKNSITNTEYQRYDNYDAIEVKPYTKIPYDYKGYMGVPVTIMDKLGPDGYFHFMDPSGEQELLYKPFGLMNSGEKNEGIRIPGSKSGKPLINGEFIYSRIIIKRVQ